MFMVSWSPCPDILTPFTSRHTVSSAPALSLPLGVYQIGRCHHCSNFLAEYEYILATLSLSSVILRYWWRYRGSESNAAIFLPLLIMKTLAMEKSVPGLDRTEWILVYIVAVSAVIPV